MADSIPDDIDFPRDPGNKLGHPAPAVAGIIQLQGNDWRDEYGKLWNSKVKYTMPDAAVVEINTSTNAVTRSFTGIGSINYNVAVSPTDGRIGQVSNEARNTLRYEPKIVGYWSTRGQLHQRRPESRAAAAQPAHRLQSARHAGGARPAIGIPTSIACPRRTGNTPT